MKSLPENPYIVKLIEVYESEDDIILVMEYMKGKDLYSKIKGEKLSESQAFLFFLQIFKGLIFLHSHGICHRDLKPDNILFEDETRLKIADFSLAQNFEKHEMKESCGTPGYMAPEVFSHEAYSEKVDIFSLGAILYSM